MHGARTPLALIAATLALIAGAAIWLVLSDAPEEEPAVAPRVDIALGTAAPDATPVVIQPAPARPAPPAAPESVPMPSPSPGSALTPQPPVGALPPSPVPQVPPPAPSPRDARLVETAPIAPRLPRAATGPPLTPAPDPALVKTTAVGALPVIAADGRASWKVYARPFNAGDTRPRVAIIVSGLGLSSAATEAAIQGLPGAVTLAFAPFADQLGPWLAQARAAGHEVLLSVPMEPVDYPRSDPGPFALLTALDVRANVERLEWMLARGVGYVGVVDLMGSRFMASRRSLRPVLQALGERGLMFVDSRSAADSVAPEVARDVGLPWVQAARLLDEEVARTTIDARLADLERIARDQGQAVGIGSSYPATLERIASWAAEAEKKGIALAPVSALAFDRGTAAR